jgi:hypothetical protein
LRRRGHRIDARGQRAGSLRRKVLRALVWMIMRCLEGTQPCIVRGRACAMSGSRCNRTLASAAIECHTGPVAGPRGDASPAPPHRLQCDPWAMRDRPRSSLAAARPD